MAKQLTAASVLKLKSGKARREIPDGGCPGLYLIVQISGAKSWALRFRRPSGRSAKLTLGSVNLSGRDAAAEPVIGAPLTLAAARHLASDVKHRRAMGHDVVAAVHREKLERAARGDKTFAQAARDFVEQHVERKTRRSKEQARLLGLKRSSDGTGLELIPKSLTERWRDRPIADIEGDDIHTIVDEVREKGVPGIRRRTKEPSETRARAMFNLLSKMFSWLVEKRRLGQNPCRGVHRPDTPDSRDRVLSGAEIVKFWDAASKAKEPFSQLLKLLLLTGARLNEVAGMRRSELSDEGKTWSLPGERTKNHRTHVVPLAPTARDLVAALRTEGDLVFTTNGKSQVSGFSKLKRKLDTEVEIPPWRLHDLRRTCATGMAEIGVAPHIVEACLNHISGAKAGVAGIYNRAAYAEEKKAALERWAAHVGGLVSGEKGKIVPIHRMEKAKP